MDNVKVFCLNGVSLSGKDTFVEIVQKQLRYRMTVYKFSTIDPIKKIYREFFEWDGSKTDIHRKNLNLLKNIWVKTSNGPLKWSEKIIQNLNSARIEQNLNGEVSFVFFMVREFDEMEALKNLAICLGCKAYTVQVVRPGIYVPPVEQEFLDSHPENYQYDITIYNPTVEHFPNVPKLEREADWFCGEYI